MGEVSIYLDLNLAKLGKPGEDLPYLNFFFLHFVALYNNVSNLVAPLDMIIILTTCASRQLQGIFIT